MLLSEEEENGCEQRWEESDKKRKIFQTEKRLCEQCLILNLMVVVKRTPHKNRLEYQKHQNFLSWLLLFFAVRCSSFSYISFYSKSSTYAHQFPDFKPVFCQIFLLIAWYTSQYTIRKVLCDTKNEKNEIWTTTTVCDFRLREKLLRIMWCFKASCVQFKVHIMWPYFYKLTSKKSWNAGLKYQHNGTMLRFKNTKDTFQFTRMLCKWINV